MSNYLMHYGILGMKWGIRRYQNEDGTLTELGKKRYANSDGSLNDKGKKAVKKGKINTPTDVVKNDENKVDYSWKSMMGNKKSSELTTSEIEAILKRFEKEQKLRDITYKPSTEEKIKKALKEGGKKAAKNLAVYSGSYLVSRLLEESIGKDAAKEMLKGTYKTEWKLGGSKKNNKNTNNSNKEEKKEKEKALEQLRS